MCATLLPGIRPRSNHHSTRFTPGSFRLPSKIKGGLSFGQYMRSIGMKSPLGAGSQFESLSAPGSAVWLYSVIPPSNQNGA